MMHANNAIQIELEEESRDITTFSDGDSLYRYKRLSSGMNMNAPEQYQNIIRHAIAYCPGATNIADDIVVYEWTTEDNDRNLVTLLERLQERNLTLNKDKSKSGMINQKYCFHGIAFKSACQGINRGKGQNTVHETDPLLVLPSCTVSWDLSVSA